MVNGQGGGAREPLGEILIREGLITREQLQRGLVRQREIGKRLGESLVELGYLSEEELLNALARQFSLPQLSLSSIAISPLPIRDRLSPKYLREH